jgi:putative transposase
VIQLITTKKETLMTNQDSNIINNFLQETLRGDSNPIANILTTIFNEAMKIERECALNTKPYERSDLRDGYANGFKGKTLKTRGGDLSLKVPQVRDSEKGFYPSIIEKGMRSEKALMLTISEMYLKGVSTRKINSILDKMGLKEISSTTVSNFNKMLDEEMTLWRERELGQFIYVQFDALYEKARIDKSAVSNAVLVGYGITPTGVRRVLGISSSNSEAEIHWRTFFQKLQKRGLFGVKMITSDAHSGLTAALNTCFPGVPWQRCNFHLQRNAQAYITKQSHRKEIAQEIKTIFNAPNIEEAQRYLSQTVEKYEKSLPRFSKWAEENIPQGLTFFGLPEEHRKKTRTSNMAERVNKEIRRRTKVVGVFPNEDSLIRLVTSVLIERDETWELEEKRYLRMEEKL